MITLAKNEKIKDPDYTLAKFVLLVNSITSWASSESEVDKPSNSYQNSTESSPMVLAFGRVSQGQRKWRSYWS